MSEFPVIYVATAAILLIFALGTGAMITRKLPALLTLPIMALAMVLSTMIFTGINLEEGVGFDFQITPMDLFNGVIKEGAGLLANAMVAAFFGGILSFILQKSGVAESMVKNGAELIGDNPFAVALFSLGLVALLFTTIGGLGAIIMVSLVLLPLMATVGIPPLAAAGVMLFGISLGGVLNATNWALYRDALQVPIPVIQNAALTVFFLLALSGIFFVTIEMYRNGAIRSLRRVASILGGASAVVAIIVTIIVSLQRSVTGDVAADGTTETSAAFFVVQVLVGLVLLAIVGIAFNDILRKVPRWRHQAIEIKWYAYLIPIVPLVLIIVYGLDPLAAFLLGVIYAVIVTARPGSVSLTVQAMIQGGASVMPAIMLFIGIGILLKAIMGPSGWSDANDGALWPVIAAIQPLFQLIPNQDFFYVAIFTICGPLALYRGPLNTWGLGFGIATILSSPAVGFSPEAIMAMLMVVGQIQGVCDPTNTHNVWLANELRVDVQQVMYRTLPYVWGMVVFGLLVATMTFPIQLEDSRIAPRQDVEAARQQAPEAAPIEAPAPPYAGTEPADE